MPLNPSRLHGDNTNLAGPPPSPSFVTSFDQIPPQQRRLGGGANIFNPTPPFFPKLDPQRPHGPRDVPEPTRPPGGTGGIPPMPTSTAPPNSAPFNPNAWLVQGEWTWVPGEGPGHQQWVPTRLAQEWIKRFPEFAARFPGLPGQSSSSARASSSARGDLTQPLGMLRGFLGSGGGRGGQSVFSPVRPSSQDSNLKLLQAFGLV